MHNIQEIRIKQKTLVATKLEKEGRENLENSHLGLLGIMLR